ncbi:hypothetical protein C8R44DRAFT_977468 [Mycena epipterygia]|nr:hypothetical protein C8R44DRAFT_977468 [Mycena epipterygia]
MGTEMAVKRRDFVQLPVIGATPSYDFSNDDFDFPSLLLDEGSLELLQDNPVNGPSSSPSIFWAGMPPPTSPRTAGMIAAFKHGQGTKGMENIDPLLYRVPRQPMYPPACPMYAGVVFEANREVGGNPGARAKANVTGFQFPVALSYPQSNLFQAFQLYQPEFTLHFHFHPIFCELAIPRISICFGYQGNAFSITECRTHTVHTDVLTQTMTPIALATLTNALTSTTKAGHPLAMKTGAGKTAKTQKLPAADADADPEPAAGDRDEALPLPAAKRRRGGPRKAPAVVDAPVAAAEDVVAAVPAMTPAARGNSTEKEMDAVAKEKEARRLKDRLHNPDGDHPSSSPGPAPNATRCHEGLQWGSN